jgi:hypothetical protein
MNKLGIELVNRNSFNVKDYVNSIHRYYVYSNTIYKNKIGINRILNYNKFGINLIKLCNNKFNIPIYFDNTGYEYAYNSDTDYHYIWITHTNININYNTYYSNRIGLNRFGIHIMKYNDKEQ